MDQVFISYSRRDLAFVNQFAADLEKAGLDVWYDVSGIGGGSRWRTEIETALRNSQYVVVVLSPDAISSEWVEREFIFSSNLKRKIIPLMYRFCELPLNYVDLNYIDVQGDNYHKNFDEILKALNKPPISRPSEKETMESSPVPIYEAKRGTNRAMLSLVVIGLAVGIILLARLFPFGPSPGETGSVTPPSTTSASTTNSKPSITPKFKPDLSNDFSITFSSRPVGGNSDILLINPVTRVTQPVITDRYHDKVGTWSPDGQYLAYESSHEDPNYYQIYLYDGQQPGTPAELLTKFDTCSNWAPTWSPDGRQIVFYSNCENGQREIFIMNSNGSGRKKLTSGTGEKKFPSFSPDGTEITFTLSQNGRDQIAIMKANGSDQKVIANGCSSTFSPDGEWLWFSSSCDDSEIQRARVNGTELTTVVTTEGNVIGKNPAVSPDGFFVVFESKSNIWVMRIDGSEPPEQLTSAGTDGAPSWKR